jgi:cyclopropane fatty-acyl-phospholipid synthase-like methyltransferase
MVELAPTVTAIPAVAELVAELDRPLVVLDVGCRWGMDARWLVLGQHARLIGFDADADECLRLRDAAAPDAETYVAAALGAGAHGWISGRCGR